MPQQSERTPKQVQTRHAFLKYLSGCVAATLITLSASYALAQGNAKPSTPHWEQVAEPPNVTFKQVALGSARAIWALNNNGLPWKWNGSSWEKLASSGGVSAISVAADGSVWATNPSDSMAVLQLDQLNKKWTRSIRAGMKQVAALNALQAWGLDKAGTLFWWNRKTTTWEKKAGTVSQISVGLDGTLWATADSQRVLRWDGKKWDEALPKGMVYVSVGSARNIWALDGANQVFKWSGSAWQKMPGSLRNIAAAWDGSVWGINAQGSVVKWVPGQAASVFRALPQLSPPSACATGPIQCCSVLVEAKSPGLAPQLAGGGLLGIQIDDIINNVSGLVGLGCVSNSLLGGDSCWSQPVCCTNPYLGGVIQAGCSPVN